MKITSSSSKWKINKNGYYDAYLPSHPLSPKNGMVKRHRSVLFAAIGDGRHPCSICGWQLDWRGPDWRHCINVDHINAIKGDDRPENLRVLCGWCNSNRNWAESFCPDDWPRIVKEQSGISPWERTSLIELLAVEWGIGSTDLLLAMQYETKGQAS